MKTFKNIFTTLLIAFVSINVNAQEEVESINSTFELPKKDNAKWKQMVNIFTELINLNDEQFKRLKGEKLSEKNRYTLTKPLKLDLFNEGNFIYFYRRGHSESIYFKEITFYEKHYKTTMENIITNILSDDYVIFKGDEVRNECVYGYNEGYNIIWKHKSEVGEREIKKRFVRLSYGGLYGKPRIYFYNIYPEL